MKDATAYVNVLEGLNDSLNDDCDQQYIIDVKSLPEQRNTANI